MSAAGPEASDDAPSRPSTWQLLFGANKKRPVATTEPTDNQHEEAAAPQRPRARSPTTPTGVAAQLLRALQSREDSRRADGEDEAIGRQCSDELLGKPNAFAPQWRHKGADSDPIAEMPEQHTREARQQAKELIAARLRVEQHAEAIRRGKMREQQRREDTRLRPATRAELRPRRVDPGMADRLQKLREIQARRDDQEKAREDDRLRRERQQQQLQTAREAREAAQRTTRVKTAGATKAMPGTRATATRSDPVAQHGTAKTPASRGVPRATALHSKSDTTLRGASKGSNQDDTGPVAPRTTTASTAPPAPTRGAQAASGRDLRVLDDKLRQLQVENQRVAALEDKLRAQQLALRIQRRVWAIWLARVERRRRHEASVVKAFAWRRQQRVWAAWRHVARAASRDRAERHARELLVREKQQLHKAERFYRARHLVLWFQRWRAEAVALRDARRLEAEMQRRREQAARLVERFARAPTSVNPSDAEDFQPQEQEAVRDQRQAPRQQSPASPSRPHARGKPAPIDVKPRTKPAVKEAWPTTTTTKTATAQRHPSPKTSTPSVSSSPPRDETTAGKPKKALAAAPSPDAFYLSMLERAEQRKVQREQLKHKYEQLEQEKRAALERQVAEREALLEKQKLEERERIREKKREEARAAREKAAQRQVAEIQQQSAALHDRLRLLYHYAFRPWQYAWHASKRVERNAAAWHALRVCHSTWLAWRAFVRARHVQRQREEQERLAVAADHHRRALLARTIAQWKLAQRNTQQKQLAVRRHVQWSATRRAWQRWHHVYALAVGEAQRREIHARRTLERRWLRTLVTAWREAAVEAKRERVRQAEKELLWKKARMWLNE